MFRFAPTVAVASLLASAAACGPGPRPLSPSAPAPVASASATTGAAADAPEDPLALAWQSETRSPRPPTAGGLARRLDGLCDHADAALERVAERVALRLLDGHPTLDPAELTLELRAAGAPYVWPKSWSYSGPALDAADTEARASKWLGGVAPSGRRACGAAFIRSSQGEGATLVLADALADLERLPTRSRVGQWLDVTAHMRVATGDAKVVVLGPRGAPHPIPTSLDQGTIRARFAPNGPGEWLVQVVADVATGPRPVAEALVHADADPPTTYQATPAPGEDAGADAATPEESLVRMVNAARHGEGLRVLRRDAELDKAALLQAEAMRDARVLGHDVGKGSVGDRIAALGLSPRAYGENVARAATAARVHRAIWASPSHRSNLLEPRYDSIGVGMARGPEGLWVAEVFAESR